MATPSRLSVEQLARALGWRPRLEAQIDGMRALRDRLVSCIGCGCLSLHTCALSNPHDAAAVGGSGALSARRAGGTTAEATG